MASSGSVPDGTDAPAMRWWGWGESAHAAALPAHVPRYVSSELGFPLRASPPVALASSSFIAAEPLMVKFAKPINWPATGVNDVLRSTITASVGGCRAPPPDVLQMWMFAG